MVSFNVLRKSFSKIGLTAGLFAAALSSDLNATPAPAGMQIINVAEARYFNEALGIYETVQSNTVAATVGEVPAIEVFGNSILRLSRGARDQHHYEIRNTGNTQLAISTWVDHSSENSLMHNRNLVWDQNGNGLADAGEPSIGANEEIIIDQSESAFMIYSFDIVSTATINQFASSALMTSARSTTSGTTVTGTSSAAGTVEIVSGTLELAKSVTRRTMADGDELMFELTLRNNSERDIGQNDDINGDEIRIDGTEMTGTLVRDDIPLNTEFVEFGASGDLTPLYHLQGDREHDYVTSAPLDRSEVDAVAFFLDADYPVGRSSDLNFTVFVARELGTLNISNIADAFMPSSTGTITQRSNEIVVHRDAENVVSLDFVNPSTHTDTSVGAIGSDTGLRLTSGACNISGNIDTTEVTVVSGKTNDTEVIIARETGRNTGIFYTAGLPLTRMDTPVSGDGVLASTDGDTLYATARCDTQVVADSLLVNPGNFVFNSVTNAPIPNATVQVVDASGQVVHTVDTDADGFFAAESIPAGQYRYVVLPPADFAFPSVRTGFAGLDRSIDREISYGGAFAHSGGILLHTDLPVDPYYGIPLTLTKEADKTRVRTGEFVTYTLTATNNMDQALIGSDILDRPPLGADLVEGSVRLDGAVQADPTLEPSGEFRFEMDMISARSTQVLTYVMRFTPFAESGRNYNTALLDGRQAGTGTYRASNIATTYVSHDNAGGVFADEGTIVGSVFLDCNGNGMRDGVEERGVPGVKLVTQAGLFVVTDIDGQFSLFGLRPVTHVLSILPDTLPTGAEPMVTRTNDLMRGGSRMVAMTRGAMLSENFPLAGCDAETISDVETRVEIFSERDTSAITLMTDLPMDAANAVTQSTRTEAGVGTTTQINSATMRSGATPDAALAEHARETAEERQTLEDIVKDLSNEPAFMDLESGDVLRRNLNVRVKGPADLELSLIVNGETVGASRIGEKTTWEGGNVQAIEFIAISLDPGENSIVLSGIGPFGNERAREEITLVAPGDPAKIDLIAPTEASAIPSNRIPVVVRILDAAGTPVEASATVTLRADAATWDVTDIRPEQPGVQAFIDNGEATFDLIPPQNSGPELIQVDSSFGNAETEIVFTPNLDERILVGIIEGAVALNGRGDLIEESRISPFEDTTTGLRGEVYLKGRIRGDALLTLRYNSDRDTEDRLFRDVRGDEYYPVYGDSSERGYDAQSSSNLFVKIEKGESYVLYGDISIDAESTAFELGGYSRVTTGAKAHWQNENVSVTIFAARTAAGQRVTEVAGRGISGPYDLDLAGYREGSERVEILLRDEDTGVIIDTFAQRRGQDYVLDFFRDAIIFNAPVAQADAEGNPYSIRVTYEMEEDGAEDYWLYGGEVNVDITENTTVGARIVHADAEGGAAERERIRAAYIRTQLNDENSLEIELAQAEDTLGNSGTAARIAFRHEGIATRLELEATTTSEHFNPGGSSTRPGSDELRMDFTGQLGRDAEINLGARYLADNISNTETAEANAVYTRRVNSQLSSRVGVEVQHDFDAADENTAAQLLIGADYRPEDLPQLGMSFDLEQTVLGEGEGELRFGLDYEFRQGWTATGQIDFGIGEDGKIDNVTRLQAGMEYILADGLTAQTDFSADGEGLATSRIVQGIRGDWDLTEQLTFGFSAEHSQPLGGQGDGLTSLAISSTWESAERDFVIEGDLDQTFEEEGNTLYTNIGVAYQVSEDLTVLGRSRMAIDKRGEDDHFRHRARVGLAYRPVADERLNLLAWYEHQLEKRDADTETHMWSISGTYELNENVRLNAKYAGQFSKVSSGGVDPISADVLTQMAQGGLTWDFGNDRWQAGVNLMHMWDNRDASTSAAGFELSYVVSEGTMFSFGFNHAMGELPGQNPFYQDGVYLRMRIVLDHSLWDRLNEFGIE